LIVLQDLVKRFADRTRGSFLAVNHLSIHVQPGEIYGLLGPNGAGKTTTLRILATLLEPDEGTVTISGVDRVASPLEVRRHMAYVAAEAGLPERLTGREVVELFAQIQGADRPRERAAALLDELGATAYADTPCGSLSTGMKRRVVLARALVHEPTVLLLDEPTDGLDVQGRREVMELVRRLGKGERAVIVSSHIMSEVQQMADRIGVMARGELVAEGTIEQVMRSTGHTNLDDAFLALTNR